MLSYDDALNLNYYKKTTFTGWMGKIRFLIKMEKHKYQVPDPEGKLDESGNPLMIEKEDPPQFHVWVWPAPYIFDLTPDSEKVDAIFPFNEEGKRQAVDWVNSHLEG